MKTWAGRRSVDDDKLSRRLELVGNRRSVREKSRRNFRIGFAENLFVDHPRVRRQPGRNRNDTPPVRFDEQMKSGREAGLSQTEIFVGLAAIAGLTFGYLIGRRRK